MIEAIPRYKVLKASELPWLGSYPEHWELQRLKFLFDERVEKGFPGEPLLTASQSHGVIPKADYESRTVEAQKDLHLLKLVEPGDYVISLRSFQGGIEYAHSRGIISPAYTVLRPKLQVRRSFFEHYFKSLPFVSSLSLFVTGIREGQNIDYERLSRAYMPLPNEEEQDAIGGFINRLDRLVGRLTRAKRRLIELLREQILIIIDQAVTNGLDPFSETKFSGFPWLGSFPAHWTAKPLKFLAREVDERSTTGQEEILSVSHVTGVTPRSQKNITMFLAASYIGHKKCKPGDLVANTMWMWMGALGVSSHDGLVSPSYAVYRANSASPVRSKYLDLLLRSKTYVNEYTRNSTGIRPSRLRLYPEQFLRMPVLLPPLNEQDEICAYVDRSTEGGRKIIERAIQEIDLILEYRTRLVADVVTGKVDVRHLDLPEVEDTLLADLDQQVDIASEEVEQEELFA